MTPRWYTPWLYLLIPLALLVTFTYLPVADMVSYSFTDWDGLSPTSDFTGLANYLDLVTRPELFQVFTVSLFYLAGSVVQIGAALYFATVLSFHTRFRNLFKGILFFPYLINGVAVGFVFLYFFQPGGTLDTVLHFFGAGPQLWLGNPDLVNWSLAGVSVWRFMGLNMVLFLAALQGVPSELYEAARIDGARGRSIFARITLPLISPTVLLTAIITVVGALQSFAQIAVLTGGGPELSTTVLVYYVFQQAFKFNDIGYGSTLALMLLSFVMVLTLLQWQLRKRWVFHEQ